MLVDVEAQPLEEALEEIMDMVDPDHMLAEFFKQDEEMDDIEHALTEDADTQLELAGQHVASDAPHDEPPMPAPASAPPSEAPHDEPPMPAPATPPIDYDPDALAKNLGLEERSAWKYWRADSDVVVGRIHVIGARGSLKATCARHPKCSLFIDVPSGCHAKVCCELVAFLACADSSTPEEHAAAKSAAAQRWRAGARPG